MSCGSWRLVSTAKFKRHLVLLPMIPFMIAAKVKHAAVYLFIGQYCGGNVRLMG